MQQGDLVKLRAYGGEEIERRVVAVSHRTVQVCNEKDYEAARGGDKRAVVGFRVEDVVTVEGAAFASDSD